MADREQLGTAHRGWQFESADDIYKNEQDPKKKAKLKAEFERVKAANPGMSDKELDAKVASSDLSSNMSTGTALGAATGTVAGAALGAGAGGVGAIPGATIGGAVGGAVGGLGGAGAHVIDKFMQKQKAKKAMMPATASDESPPWVKKESKVAGGNTRGVISKSNADNPQFIAGVAKMAGADAFEKKPVNPAVVRSAVFKATGSGKPSVGMETHHVGIKFEDKKK